MDERAKLQELFRANQERLHELQLRKAKMGFDTPPHVDTEIRAIKEEIHKLESQISSRGAKTTRTKEDVISQPLDGVLKRLDHLSSEITELRREIMAVGRFTDTPGS